MAEQPHQTPPLPKGWPRSVRSAAIQAIALARLALTTARGQTGKTSTGAGLSPAGTMNLCTAHLDHYTFAGFGQRQVFELEYFSGARFMEAKIFGMAGLLNFSPW